MIPYIEIPDSEIMMVEYHRIKEGWADEEELTQSQDRLYQYMIRSGMIDPVHVHCVKNIPAYNWVINMQISSLLLLEWHC